MKKCTILLLVLIVRLVAVADPACPDSLCLIQPNGDTLWTYLHGDEFYHWHSTIDGQVIIRNSNNYFCYAVVEGDSLRSSGMVAHNVESRSISEQDYVNSINPITQQFIQTEIQEAYTIALNDSLLFPPAQHAASNPSATQPIIGTRKVLTILMEFEDRKFSNTRVAFDSLMNQRNGAIGPNYGSVRKYYHENSYGQMIIEATVIGPFEAKNLHTAYQRERGGNTYNSQKLVQEAIKKAKNIVDFSTLDGDNDGYVDCVHVVYAGTRYVNNSSTEVFIWPYKSTISTTSVNGKTPKGYIVTPELANNQSLAPIGTICHELGHILGAPDYYDASDIFHAMGKYDVMDEGSWNKGGYSPSHHNPYTKCYIFGWDTPKLINSKTNNYTLSSSTRNKGHVYRINTSVEGEYFLLENRTNEQFDIGIPGGGLLFYHIHKDLVACISSGDSINNTHPLKLYLVNANASSNPNNNPNSYGKSSSFRAFPGLISDKTMFTSATNPSATAWNGIPTGVNICFINRNYSNGNITFTVNPEIQGPSQLCGTRDYCISGTVPNADIITWSYTTDITEAVNFPALRFEEGKIGKCIPIQRGHTINMTTEPLPPGHITMTIPTYSIVTPIVGDPHIGTAKLRASITNASDTFYMEKDIIMPEYVTPSLSSPLSNTAIWKLNETRILNESSCDSIETEYIKWYVSYPNTETEEFIGRSVTLTPTQEGQMTIRIVNECGCNSSKETTYTYTVRNYGLRYPNPVNTPNLELEIIKIGEMDGFYTIELWQEQYGRVKYITTQEDNVQINVSDLPNGWYQIVLRKDGELIDSGNIMINK